MVFKICWIFFLFFTMQVLGLGPFVDNKQDLFLETNSLNLLDLFGPIPDMIKNLTDIPAEERRSKIFLINQMRPRDLARGF